MTNEKNIAVKSAFATFLQSKGLRETFERKAIFDAIVSISGSFDYAILSDVLKNNGEQICRATIFNTLSLLLEGNLIRRKHFANGQNQYELVASLPAGNQLHLLCTSCGRITDLRNAAIIRELRHMKFGSFLPEYLSMTVYGMCSKCQRKAGIKKSTDAIQLKLFK